MEDTHTSKKLKTEHPSAPLESQSIRLLDLPNDLIFEIFEQLPNFYSVVALRLSCKRFDLLHRRYPSLLKAQRDRITKPLLDYYTFLTTLHIDSDDIKFIRNLSPQFQWSDYTMRIIREMPHLQTYYSQPTHHPTKLDSYDHDVFGNTHSLDLEYSHNSRQQVQQETAHNWMIPLCNLARQCGINLHRRNVVSLCDDGTVFLDTMKAEVWFNPSSVPKEWVWQHQRMPAEAFWRYQRQRLLDLKFIPKFGAMFVAIIVGDPQRSHLTQDQHDRLLALFHKHGWPENFEREKARAELQTYWQGQRYQADATQFGVPFVWST